MSKKQTRIKQDQGAHRKPDETDAPELDAAWFEDAHYGFNGLAKLVGEANVAPLRKVGRPKSAAPKRNGTLRLSADIWDTLKASGRGYNARVEALLREAIHDGRL